MSSTLRVGRPPTLNKYRILTPGAVVRTTDELTTYRPIEDLHHQPDGKCFGWIPLDWLTDHGACFIGKYIKDIEHQNGLTFTFRRLK